MKKSLGITQILADGNGNEESVAEVMTLLYEDLRRIARRKLQPGAAITLNTTELVHEAYIKLTRLAPISCTSQGHFLAVVAMAMRQIVADHAKRHRARKRWGSQQRVPLDASEVAVQEEADMIIAVDEALSTLASFDERLCRLVECRVFAGFTVDETAMALGISRATFHRDWIRAKAWLKDEIGGRRGNGRS